MIHEDSIVAAVCKADYAFISHMVEIALEGESRAGMIVSHGVLFLSAAEGIIRKQFITTIEYLVNPEKDYGEKRNNKKPSFFYPL